MTNRASVAAAAALLAWPVLAAAATQSKVVEYSFAAGADGNSPRGKLLAVANGTFYGTTSAGGAGANGTVFHLESRTGKVTNNEQALYTFTGEQDGSFPNAGVLQGSNGAFYGTAALDGKGGRGTVFRLNPPVSGSTIWTETTLWSFTGGADGGQPLGTLIADRSGSGVLYGTTRIGGASNDGVVFSLTPPASGNGAWTETVLASLSSADTGAQPTAALLQDNSGALYGTASAGGPKMAGTVFRLSPPAASGGAWTMSVIFAFSGGAEGATPQGTLVADASGALYGTAVYGGQSGCPASNWPYYGESPSVTNVTLNAPYIGPGQNRCGIAFMLSPPSSGSSWSETVLWSFTGGVDGDSPSSELLLQGDGALYGTTPLTAGALKGVLFKLSPPASAGGPYTETTLQSFQHELQGSYPRAGVVLGQDGRLYGTNNFGGHYWVHVKDYGYGAVYGALPQ